VLLLNALGLLRDIKTHAENSGSNTKTSLAAKGSVGSDRLVDVKKGGVDLRVARQGVGLKVTAADLLANLGNSLEVP
jgi:hypothetical protein